MCTNLQFLMDYAHVHCIADKGQLMYVYTLPSVNE